MAETLTPKITREEIEKRKARAERGLAHFKELLASDNGELRQGDKTFIRHHEEEIALCTLALQAEAMQPRPIEEAPKDGTRFLAFQKTSDAGNRKFNLGDRVEKISGSSWRGYIVGFYATKLTPEGYAVESENEPGSVQIYPAAAIRSLKANGESE